MSYCQHCADLEERLRQAEDILVKGSEVDKDRSRQLIIMADLQEEMSVKCEAQEKRIAELEASLVRASDEYATLMEKSDERREAKDEQIRLLREALTLIRDHDKKYTRSPAGDGFCFAYRTAEEALAQTEEKK